MKYKHLFYYDETSPSCLRWSVDRSSWIKRGDVAGTLNSVGYWVVQTGGKGYCVHRIILALHNMIEMESDLEVDHIDRYRSNNKISNLRVVTHLTNMKNMGLRKANRSGISGVRFCGKRGKWLAEISHLNKSINLGSYSDFFDACCARKSAELIYHK